MNLDRGKATIRYARWLCIKELNLPVHSHANAIAWRVVVAFALCYRHEIVYRHYDFPMEMFGSTSVRRVLLYVDAAVLAIEKGSMKKHEERVSENFRQPLVDTESPG